LIQWLSSSFGDFDEEIIEHIKKFIYLVRSDSLNSLAERLEQALYSQIVGISPKVSFTFSDYPPQPKIPEDFQLSIFTVKPIEFARQITLYDFECFSTITVSEFLNKAWCVDNLKYRSPNVLKMINRFNNLSKWVTHFIVSEANLKIRKKKYITFQSISLGIFI